MRIGIIGGGVNGLTSAWKLAKQGNKVDLFEKKNLMSETSASSSKLLHGGIRYLEYGHFSLVRKSLLDRHKWLNLAPEYCKSVKMVIPVYKNSRRSIFILYFGAKLYSLLAGRYSLGPTSWHTKKESKELYPEIVNKDLKGSISFYDAQMDEKNLGKWIEKQAKDNGVNIYEQTPINSYNNKGELLHQNKIKKYDLIINATGPWAFDLNINNKIKTDYSIELIKGSHLVIDKRNSNYFMFQELDGKRIVFVLPYLGKTLIGTTEVMHHIKDPISCSNDERDYLLNIYNQNFIKKVTKEDIFTKFSGLRPIIRKTSKKNTFNFIEASREAEIEVNKRLFTIYGGKWTSALSLADELICKVNKFGKNYD
jgi:glycerol-3-phosphate dehydrogenase